MLEILGFTGINGWGLFKSSFEIFLIFIMVYAMLRFIQGTRGVGILRGLAFIFFAVVVIGLFFIKKLKLTTLDWLITDLFPVFVIPIIILFQPEFRRALVRLGQHRLFTFFIKTDYSYMDEIIKAAVQLSQKKVGALIAIEREVGLDNYIEGGIRLNADVSSDLLTTIFWSGAPLHDGAVIIQEQKIVAAGCLLPLSESADPSKKIGTRHSAGIGLTEETDSIVIIVSEETSSISVAVRGELKSGLSENELREFLSKLMTEAYIPVRSNGVINNIVQKIYSR
ncbi:MAG: diadenylate cyclase CdaA [Candidatus Brocadiales bacterium]